MNIEKIYSALKEDQMNSALGIINSELEAQGYEIEIEGIKVTSKEIFENKFPSLEEVAEPLNIILFKDGKEEQKFLIDFIEYNKLFLRSLMRESKRKAEAIGRILILAREIDSVQGENLSLQKILGRQLYYQRGNKWYYDIQKLGKNYFGIERNCRSDREVYKITPADGRG